jgi:hypothetical protein
MRSYRRIVPIGVILIAALLFVATRGKSQAPSAQVWEYATVAGSPGFSVATKAGAFSQSFTSVATICYATAEGCRNEDVTATSSKSFQGTESIAMAVAELGDEGWELITATDVDSTRLERVLYFRRLKTDSN